MAFNLKYEQVVRVPNPMSTINPLKRKTGKTVSLQDRVDKLNKSSAWKRTVKKWITEQKQVDLDRMPKFSMEKLGVLDIEELIQRDLDDKHCANKIGDVDLFDPALLQPVICIKTSKGKFISIDAQHTAATLAGLIDAGFMPGVTDWREFEYAFWYIETDNLAYARKAFGILNGKGKKKQSQYQQLRTSVYVVRIDKDRTDPEDVETERMVSIAEKHNCFPVEEDSDLLKHPGTFSNVSIFKTLTPTELDVACEWHNQYFHYEGIHVNLFFIYKDLCREFGAAKMPISDKFKEELAALIQSLFGNLAQFAESCKEAYRLHHIARHNYQGNWRDEAYACALVQLYQKFGGKEKIAPSLLDRYDDLVEFFDEDIISLA
jgi:hypothetical protein